MNLLLLSLVLAAHCRPMAPNSIMGGTEVKAGEYAWLANRNLKCGGALISSQWIITAGHCVYEVGDLVTLNKLNLFGPTTIKEEIISVSQSITHPHYQRSAVAEENDIRLVKLSIPSEVVPARLVTWEEAQIFEQPGTLLTVAGWGALEESGDIAGRLREVMLPVVANSVCADADHYAKVRQIYDSMMCAGYAAGGRDACSGDSGSPLFAEIDGKGVIVGITSWGVGCGRPNRPGVFTRVSKYLDWIASVLNGTYVAASVPPLLPTLSPPLPFSVPISLPVPVSPPPILPSTSKPTPSPPTNVIKMPTPVSTLQALSSAIIARYIQPIPSRAPTPAPSILSYFNLYAPRPNPVVLPTAPKSSTKPDNSKNIPRLDASVLGSSTVESVPLSNTMEFSLQDVISTQPRPLVPKLLNEDDQTSNQFGSSLSGVDKPDSNSKPYPAIATSPLFFQDDEPAMAAMPTTSLESIKPMVPVAPTRVQNFYSESPLTAAPVRVQNSYSASPFTAAPIRVQNSYSDSPLGVTEIVSMRPRPVGGVSSFMVSDSMSQNFNQRGQSPEWIRSHSVPQAQGKSQNILMALSGLQQDQSRGKGPALTPRNSVASSRPAQEAVTAVRTFLNNQNSGKKAG